ncbi:MAG TPA: FlgD immunoglobulin-like domain containing protein [Clostridia bacterium]|nr:FlgD immunoglobulin-like domain containing protein [Clostridia bacterium]
MNLKRQRRNHLMLGGLAIVSSLAIFATSAHANVYATNLKLNGGTTNVVLPRGGSVEISYLLNEPASSGVTVKILSGANVVCSLAIPPNSEGAYRGQNTLFWGGTNNFGNRVSGGTYSVSITAASSGYSQWTQITSDQGDPYTYVYEGRSISVNRNTNSPFYGRIFVANANIGPDPQTPGDVLGILKFNADGSAADDGITTGGSDGHEWSGGGVSPFKVEVSTDDYVYVSDLANRGEVYRWDPTFSTNSLLSVLSTNNLAADSWLSGLAVVGTGTNTQIFMAGTNATNSGVFRWKVTGTGACASNDLGMLVVGSVTNIADVALDKNGNLYVCSSVSAVGDPAPRVFRFRAYDPSTNGGAPALVADWAVGATNDAYGDATGIAVDPTGTYVAVSFLGVDDFGLTVKGNTKVLYATNGALVTEIDLEQPMNGLPYTQHLDTDCAWDAVGNLYYVDWFYGKWRAVSPPGTNHSTTVAFPTIQISTSGEIVPPTISKISISGNTVTIDFSAGDTDAASNFTLQSSASPAGTYAAASGASITQVSPGSFRATVPVNGGSQFYRIRR